MTKIIENVSYYSSPSLDLYKLISTIVAIVMIPITYLVAPFSLPTALILVQTAQIVGLLRFVDLDYPSNSIAIQRQFSSTAVSAFPSFIPSLGDGGGCDLASVFYRNQASCLIFGSSGGILSLGLLLLVVKGVFWGLVLMGKSKNGQKKANTADSTTQGKKGITTKNEHSGGNGKLHGVFVRVNEYFSFRFLFFFGAAAGLELNQNIFISLMFRGDGGSGQGLSFLAACILALCYVVLITFTLKESFSKIDYFGQKDNKNTQNEQQSDSGASKKGSNCQNNPGIVDPKLEFGMDHITSHLNFSSKAEIVYPFLQLLVAMVLPAICLMLYQSPQRVVISQMVVLALFFIFVLLIRPIKSGSLYGVTLTVTLLQAVLIGLQMALSPKIDENEENTEKSSMTEKDRFIYLGVPTCIIALLACIIIVVYSVMTIVDGVKEYLSPTQTTQKISRGKEYLESDSVQIAPGRQEVIVVMAGEPRRQKENRESNIGTNSDDFGDMEDLGNNRIPFKSSMKFNVSNNK